MDVAVVGGGIVGTAVAAFLAEAGARVTVYEREAIAAGASGRNSGVVQHPFDPALVPLYRDTVDIYRWFDRERDALGFRLAPRPAGLLLVSRSIELVDALALDLRALHPALAPEALGADAVQRLEPALAPGTVACRVDIGFPVVPSAPTYAMATLAERRGATIRQGRAAVPVVEDGRCTGIEVGGRVVAADAVVVAAGPWTPGVVDPSGRWRPIRPVWGVVVETLLADPPGHVLELADMDEALATKATGRDAGHAEERGSDGEPGGAVAADWGQPLDGEGSVGFSLVTAGGVSVVGSTFLEREPDLDAWVEPLLAGGAFYVPSIADAPIREVRACARPGSLDGRPLIGTLPGAEGLVVCSGHGPWGITTGPASARIAAELVLGRATPDAVPAALRADRFGTPFDV